MKRKLISSLLCLCMLFSLIPSAAFAGNEEDEGTGATASPAIYSVGYAEKQADARTQIAKEMTDAKGGTASTAGSDADDQTMWVIFKGLDTNAKYNVKLTKGGTEIKLSEDSIKAGKNGPGGTAFQTTSGFCAVYWTFKQTASKTNGTVMASGIEVGDYTIQLQKQVEAAVADEQATPTFEDVTDVKQDFSIGSITIKSSSSDNSAAATYYKGGTKVTLEVPAAPAGQAFDGWAASDNSTVPANNEVTVGNTAVTYTAKWKAASTEILQAGFSWKAADANQGLMDAITNIGKNGTIRDSIDQTVWLLVQRPAAETDAQDDSGSGRTALYYWYVVEDSEGATLFEGPVTIGAAYTASSAYFSFLHFGHNEKKVVAPADGKMTVKLYQLQTEPEEGKTPTLTGITPLVKDIDAGPNPTEITAVTPNVSGGSVKVDFNQVMSGRYYIELVKEGTETPVKTYNSDCDWDSNPPGTFETHTFDGVDFTAGKYTVNLYPRAVGTVDVTGKLENSTPIDSKSFTLDGTINSVDVYVGESDTPSTAITAEVDEAAKTITLKGDVANPANMTLRVVAQTGIGEVKNDEVSVTYSKTGTPKFTVTDEKITVLGQDYVIKADGLSAVDTPIAPPATDVTVTGNIPEGKEEAVLDSAGSVTTTDVATLTDLATSAAAEVDKTQANQNDTSYDVSTAAAKLGAELNTTVSDSAVTVVVQPYLDVAVGNYTESDSGNVLNLNISAKYRVVATTADVSKGDTIVLPEDDGTTNAVDITKSGTDTTMEVKTAITIQLDLPTGFVSDTNDLYVKHYDKHYHQGTVAAKGGAPANGYTLTFTSTDGLSPFSIDTSANPEAKIGDTYYNTFNEAVNAVKDGETITILKNGTYEATVNSTVKFKVVKDAGAASATITLKDADGNTVEPDEEGFYSFTGSGNPSNPSDPTGPSGGGGGVSSNVTVSSATNGKVTVTPTAPSKGATVTINLTPDAGYAVGTVTVTDKDGNAVELTKVDDTHYTFVMPDGKVTVKATFTQTETPSATGFTDVAADAYYADAVKWAVEKGITNGLTATTFGPNNSCTRGQMVTFLWRAAGSPAASGTNSFADVASGEYYYNAVLWAVEKGITNGTSATTFSPNATVNRGQTVTFLYRYAGSPAATGDTSFTDVASSAFYADAVKWAVAEEITNGTSATTFSPASNCTRGQIVTFMYRQMAE